MENKEIEVWIEKAPAAMDGIIRECRALVMGTDPAITEGIKWRNLFFQWEGQNLAAVVPYRDHVNLQFWKAVFLEDTEGRLEGTGKEARHLKISRAQEIDEEYITRLIKETIDLYAGESG